MSCRALHGVEVNGADNGYRLAGLHGRPHFILEELPLLRTEQFRKDEAQWRGPRVRRSGEKDPAPQEVIMEGTMSIFNSRRICAKPAARANSNSVRSEKFAIGLAAIFS
jgi:hypothetical protein